MPSIQAWFYKQIIKYKMLLIETGVGLIDYFYNQIDPAAGVFGNYRFPDHERKAVQCALGAVELMRDVYEATVEHCAVIEPGRVIDFKLEKIREEIKEYEKAIGTSR